uniref:Phospholipase A and acyltransferase 1-like n=1 Tax=Paramormyrops kingsleyae TaxID=1676925 RepID=A0A3B3T1X2_9TELE
MGPTREDDNCWLQRALWELGVNAHPELYPGDIIEFPRNKYFSHFGVYYGERDGVPYVAHLTSRDSDSKLLLFGRALKSTVKLDPLNVVGKKYKVRNDLDEKHPPRDFYSLVKPEIDEAIGKLVTYDILFHNSEHQATMFRYGVKKSEQIEKVYAKIVPTWKSLFEKKKM